MAASQALQLLMLLLKNLNKRYANRRALPGSWQHRPLLHVAEGPKFSHNDKTRNLNGLQEMQPMVRTQIDGVEHVWPCVHPGKKLS